MGSFLGGPVAGWTALRLIVTACVAVYVLELLLVFFAPGAGELLFRLCALRSWDVDPTGTRLDFNFLFPVQLVTYMLLHDVGSMSHVFWNLVLLWMFGRELEEGMGRTAFLRLFLAGGIIGGLLQWGYNLWSLDPAPTIGASGAVYTIMVSYALRWPRRTIILFPLFLPVPVMLVVGFKILGDLTGFLGGGSQVAHLVHLGGAAVGLLWHTQGDLLGRMSDRLTRRRAERSQRVTQDDRREMDRILAKIQASGLSSLDSGERRFLDQRSRALRQGKA